MRYSASEKREMIKLVEQSSLPVSQTLRRLDINKSTFYNWLQRYRRAGDEALTDKHPGPNRAWNQLPESRQTAVVDLALSEPELSPRELAVKYTDEQAYFVSESTVYRLLKAQDLITSPAYMPDAGIGPIPATDDSCQPDVANRLYLPQGHRLGLVLSIHRSG